MDSIMIALTTITFCCLWFKNERVWQGSYLVLFVFGLATGSLSYLAILPAAFLAWSLYKYEERKHYPSLFLAAIIVVALALGFHVVPGFNNFKYLEGISLSPEAATFDIWFNYDKSMFGLFVVGIVLRDNLIRSAAQLKTTAAAFLPLTLAGIISVYFIGIVLGYSTFDWTPSLIFLPWALKNIVFTVLAEEALFRGLIQRELEKRFGSNGMISHLVVIVPGVLFGVAHFAGGIQYIVLSSLAGILYGYSYKLTGRIEAPIVAHFLLNAGHFLFFTYPYLAV